MPTFVVFARVDPDDRGEPDDELLKPYARWNETVRAEGRWIAGGACDPGGRVLTRGDSGLSVTEAPDGQQTVGGFVIVRAADYDEAVRLAATHPHLDWGALEVRRLFEM
ncbi:YciI family protein [Nonomuraea sp. SYSU D8015]|uniref:YciI family protein n=1 Tax=Nonomuraea sp. SYSU D8015 TaxID=2593644 RepID=UPI0016607106|nr:YciI family protein [Nonomuraea sp. SYSU D8015]